MLPEAKPFFSSKFVWFGILQMAYGAIGLYLGFLDHETGIGFITTGFTTIYLRIKTSQPIAAPSLGIVMEK